MSLRARLATTPAGFSLSWGRVLAIYAGLGVSLLLAALDQTIVATVMPHIVADLGDVSQYPWVFTAYMLTSTVTVPLYGKLGDIYGRRLLFLVAMSIFVASSLFCGLAGDMFTLIVFRGLQGVGAGALFPLALATAADIVPARERGRYLGLLGAGFAAGAVLGPLTGGFITATTSWRWVFYINVPLGLIALVIVLATMPERSRRRTHSIDWLGAGLLAAATSALLLGLAWGGQQYPWLSFPVLAALAGSLVLGATFAAVERRVREPILPFSYMRQRTVTASILATGLASMAMYGVMSYVPLFVDAVVGASTTAAGAVITPLLVGDVAASFVTGQWIARTGRLRANALAGSIVFTCGTFLVWRMSVDTTSGEAARNMLVMGVGLGLMMPVYTIVVQNAVPAAVVGAATALTQSARSIGSTLGVALVGLIVNQHLSRTVQGSLTEGSDVRLASLPLRVALGDALQPAFLATAVAAALVILVAVVGIENTPLRRSVHGEDVAVETLP